jgi:ABC-type phosphate transport system substrate-binding protein
LTQQRAIQSNPHGPGKLTGVEQAAAAGPFDGKISNWSEVGGDNQRVVPINRVAGSGTRQTVQSGTWPIGGPGLAITRGPATPLEAVFLNYLIGQSFEADPVWDNLGYVAPSSPAVGKPAAN